MEKKQGVLYPSNEKILYVSGEKPLRLLPRKLYQIINYCSSGSSLLLSEKARFPEKLSLRCFS